MQRGGPGAIRSEDIGWPGTGSRRFPSSVSSSCALRRISAADVLEVPDLAADGAPRHQQFVCGLGEVENPCHGLKGAVCIQLR